MPAYVGAGADAATDYDAEFRKIIGGDPDIQAVIQRVWGTGERPSDTPKHLEKANHAASQEIGQILRNKGIDLPDRTFINPRSGTIEGHRGWSGLNGWQKAIIIAAAAAATGGAGLALAGGAAAGAGAAGGAGAAAAGGGAAGAGLGVTGGLGTLAGVGATGIGAGGAALGTGAALGSGLGVTSGLGSLSGAGATGVGAGGTSVGGSSLLGSAATNAGINAAKTKLTGGSWGDTLKAAGTGAATGAFGGGGMSSWADLLKDPDTYATIASIAGNAAGGKSDQRMQENQLGGQFNNSEIARYQTEQAAQNQAGQLDLQRKMFSEDVRAGRGKQAALADLLANLQDISINVPGVQTANVTGGLRPSAMGSTGRQGMAELSKQALAALMSGDQFTGGEILKGPQISAPKGAGGTEKTLDWLGLLGSLGGGIGKSLEDVQEPGKYSALQPQGVVANQRNVRF